MSCQGVGLHANATPLLPSLESALPLSGSRTKEEEEETLQPGLSPVHLCLQLAVQRASPKNQSDLGLLWLCFLIGLAFLLRDLVPERLELEETTQQKSLRKANTGV